MTRSKSTRGHCIYCGKTVSHREKEHVIPKCLYAKSWRSQVNLLTVPTCRNCNASWCDDEPHFRDVMLLAGEPNEAARELWNTKTLRALQQPDGRRRAADLRALFVERHGPNGTQHWIYPDHDERVVRILRKIVRGLAFHHFGMVGISDDRVRAETLRYVIPEGTLDDLHHGHRLAEVFAYWYTDLRKDPTTHFDTVWLIRIFERRWFIVWVLEA